MNYKTISAMLIQASLYLVLPVSILILEVSSSADAPILVKTNCNSTCGDVLIPFPFGIGRDCFLNPWFEIECRPSTNSNGFTSLKPFLAKFNNTEVLEVNFHNYSTVRVSMPPLNACSVTADHLLKGTELRESQFKYAADVNVFMMVGCPANAFLINENNVVMAECGTVCNNNNSEVVIPTNSCYGVHCCQTALTQQLQFYQIEFNGLSNGENKDCLVASLIERDYVNQYIGKLSNSSSLSRFPVVLDWSLRSNTEPHNLRAHCSFPTPNEFYCECNDGYYGNPYLTDGCQVPQECENCQGSCFGHWNITGQLSMPGSYYCQKTPVLSTAAILGFSISLGIILLVIVLYGLYRFVKRRREERRRTKFFKRNGGLLLKQQLSSNEGVVERTRIFSNAELDKAMDNFNENRILGQGGQGTVYKGMLTDGRIVAIKKAKLLDESQLVQFINEVVVLSQINHRNVVKLLGCCLETKVPLLVYEFISNGTLSDHIHNPGEDFVISWETCLKVAVDSAAAIAYLHSSSSVPIFHRDIKSSNILLDEKHRAKVSDFGSSRTIAIDQTHMTTIVQGTMGYLDPEYFHSYQFTEKSDVYSFGVVLLEILTKKKPIYRDNNAMEQKNLVTEFLFMTQNCRLPDILDPKIVQEAKEDELISVVKLARRCISRSGRLRPTMKEVAMTLEMIMKSPTQVTRWYQEQEPFPVQLEEYDEYSMSDINVAEFSSRTLPAASSRPAYFDGHPLLHKTQ